MTIEPKDGKVVLDAVQAAVDRYGASQDEIIPILNDVNREIGFLPGEALDELSRLLKVPKSQLFSVASYYHML
jgi:NADH:ubiquinone oxidoreductase subunit E